MAWYHSQARMQKSTRTRISKVTAVILEVKKELMMTRVMARVETRMRGGRIWVRGGKLVKPLWFIFSRRVGAGGRES